MIPSTILEQLAIVIACFVRSAVSARLARMCDAYRQSLLKILVRLDQTLSEADAILAEPGDVENVALAEELRELLTHMQARVEGKLEALAGDL